MAKTKEELIQLRDSETNPKLRDAYQIAIEGGEGEEIDSEEGESREGKGKGKNKGKNKGKEEGMVGGIVTGKQIGRAHV